MPSPILARADALMQRRRPSTPDSEDVPVLTDAINSEEDDIPTLVEIALAPTAWPEPELEPEPAAAPLIEPGAEEPIEAIAPLAAATADADPAFDHALLDIVAHELARRVNQRLVSELPAIIEATVRDFLAERELLERIRPRD